MGRFDYRDPGEDRDYCDGLAPDPDDDQPVRRAADFHPQPKPATGMADRIKRNLARLSKDRAFRAAVWARDKGICQYCGKRVKRTIELDPRRGEVHHLRGRLVAPEDRYNPARAVLLCLADHQKAQRHEIMISEPRSDDHDH